MDPYKELGKILEMRMAGHAAKATSGMSSELGTITSSGLKIDNFKHEIKDYLIADWLVKIHFPDFELLGQETCMESNGLITTASSVDTNGNLLPNAVWRGLAKYSFKAKIVDDVRIELKTKLQPGDRVLAIPVNGGQDAVIIAKVVS